ncbi:MAG: GerMN domain-containing protein [Oscillospiraceae bacterium]
MKKILAVIAAVISLLSLTACGGAQTEASPTATPSSAPSPVVSSTGDRAADYFPIAENTHYVYEGEGNEYASYDVYVDYTAAGKIQQRVNNGGTELARILSVADDKAEQVYSREEAYYRENLLDKTSESPEVLLMAPIEKATTWTLADGRVRTITDTEAEVTTPLGTYTAVAVTTEGETGTTINYYAAGVGLVKSIFRSGDLEVSSTLSRIEQDADWTQTVRFYFPDSTVSQVQFTDVAVAFATNDETGTVLADAYRTTANGTTPVFSADVTVNSLYLGDDGIVYLDLSSAFVTGMNAGSGTESLILQSVTNTFCRYYSAQEMLLTIDGKRYESGHIALQEGETLTADYA